MRQALAAGWIRAEELQKFPCKDLETIAQLWVRYRNNHFEFSVQRQIWLNVGEEYGKFGDAVEWRLDGSERQ